eukprot:4204134-Prymnesium_polylepis.1
MSLFESHGCAAAAGRTSLFAADEPPDATDAMEVDEEADDERAQTDHRRVELPSVGRIVN